MAFGRELHQALEESNTGFAVADRAGRIVLANPAWCHVHGCTDANAVGYALVDFIADRRAGEALLERARRHGAAVSELDHVRLDGERFAAWMTLSSIQLPGEPPSWSGFTVLLRDATAQQNTERLLRDAEERLRMLSEFVCEYAYSLRLEPDGATRIEWLSERFWELSGIPRGPIEPEQIEGLIPAEDIPRVREWIVGVINGTVREFEHRVVDRHGRVHWVSNVAQAIPERSGAVRIHGAAQAITERKRAEAALLDSEARFRALAENASDLIVETDERDRIVYVSPSAREILGYSPSIVSGSTLREMIDLYKLIHPDDVERLMSAVLATDGTDEPIQSRARYRHLDGGYRWLAFTTRSFETATGAKHRVAIGRDVTSEVEQKEQRERHAETLEAEVRKRTRQLEAANHQLRELQGRLIYAERLGAAEDLAASVAHAINNPLAALLGTVDMEIEAQQPPGDRILRIRKLGLRIRDVIRRTLDLFRQGTLQLAPESPARIVDEVQAEIEGRARAQNIQLDTKIEDGLRDIVVDRTLLVAALVSIAENSLDAMPTGGDLWIEAIGVAGVRVVQFRISDSGPGVPEELLEKVFEPFFTTKSAGTGLGLAIASGVIRGHEGRIVFERRSGGGTTVRVDVPVQRTGRLRG